MNQCTPIAERDCKGTAFFRDMQIFENFCVFLLPPFFLLPPKKIKVRRPSWPYTNKKRSPVIKGERSLVRFTEDRLAVLLVVLCAADLPTRAYSSYMYLNYVQVVNTRSSSALPNRRFPSCRGPHGKFNCVADHIQHHKFSNNRPSWFLRHRGRSSGRGSSAGR